jgi:hypothetical protein
MFSHAPESRPRPPLPFCYAPLRSEAPFRHAIVIQEAWDSLLQIQD